MVYLDNVLKAWGSDCFRSIVKQELESLAIDQLPLQQALTVSSYVADKAFSVMVLAEREQTESIIVKLAVFYSGVIAGCNCADDPSPIEEQNEYCELQLEIDKQTAAGNFSIV